MFDLIVVSGGQTGVDRGALRAAIKLGYAHSGYCPRGRKADDGVIPAEFRLIETETADYRERTRRNVEEADGSLVLTYEDEPTGGTRLTVDLLTELRKPGMVLTLQRDSALSSDKKVARFIRGWIEHRRFTILNVAGPRERKAPGIEEHTARIVGIALQPRDQCICGRGFPADIWKKPTFAEEGTSLRCSVCGHETAAEDFLCPTLAQLESIRAASGVLRAPGSSQSS